MFDIAIRPTAPVARFALARAALLGGIWHGVMAILAPHEANAIDSIWTGPGTEWTTGANWNPSLPDNTAVFTNNGAPTSVTISNNTSINTIQFDVSAPAYSFTLNSGAALNINGAGIVNNSSFTPNLTNNGSLNFNTTTSASAVITMSGSGGLTKTGTGTLTLSGASNITGDTNVGGGTLAVTNGGTLVTNNLSVATNMTISGAGSDVRSNFMAIGASGSLTISDGGQGVVGIGGFGASIVEGNTTVTVTGTDSVTGIRSHWITVGILAMGFSGGPTTLTVADGGLVEGTSGTGIRGTLNLGTGGLAGEIRTPSLQVSGQIVANFTDTLTFRGASLRASLATPHSAKRESER